MNLTITYFKFIKSLQSFISLWSIVVFLFALPVMLTFTPSMLPKDIYTTLYAISLGAVTFVMLVRPLADIFGWKWLRALVILRKSFGILSASIIMSFVLVKIMQQGGGFFLNMLTVSYWSMVKYKLLAHLGDITGFLLLITSNNFSKRVMGKAWKRLQKLSYVYFYTGAFYEALALQDFYAIIAIMLVSTVVVIAAIKNNLFK